MSMPTPILICRKKIVFLTPRTPATVNMRWWGQHALKHWIPSCREIAYLHLRVIFCQQREPAKMLLVGHHKQMSILKAKVARQFGALQCSQLLQNLSHLHSSCSSNWNCNINDLQRRWWCTREGLGLTFKLVVPMKFCRPIAPLLRMSRYLTCPRLPMDMSLQGSPHYN